MSYDLSVHTKSRLSLEHLREIAGGVKGLRVTENVASEHGHFILERRLKSGWVHVGDLSGPLKTEREDLSEEVLAAAPEASWLYEFSAPYGAAVNVQFLLRYARGVAKKGSGIVYDPQQDGVVWPRTREAPRPSAEETMIDTVSLEWYIRRSDVAPDLAGAVLDAIEQTLPEAMPRRFGLGEPYQRSWKKDGREGFIEEWQRGRMGMDWVGSPPLLHGTSFHLGPPYELFTGENLIGDITLSFDGRILADGSGRRRLVSLFLEVIQRGGWFFAVSRLTRSVLLRSGRPWHTAVTDGLCSLAVNAEWQGLPPEPYWLAWFGPPYLESVGRGVRALGRVTDHNGGLLVEAEPPVFPDGTGTEPEAPASAASGPTAWLRRVIRSVAVPTRPSGPSRLGNLFPTMVARRRTEEDPWGDGTTIRARDIPPGL